MPPRPKKKVEQKERKSKETLKKKVSVQGSSSHVQRKSSSNVKLKQKKKGEISIQVSGKATGKWKLIHTGSVDHVQDIVKAAVIEVVSKAPRSKRCGIADILSNFAEKYINELKKQKVPNKKIEPYTKLRQNINKMEEMLNSSDARIDRLEIDIATMEKEISKMETLLARGEEESLTPIFADIKSTLGLASFP